MSITKGQRFEVTVHVHSMGRCFDIHSISWSPLPLAWVNEGKWDVDVKRYLSNSSVVEFW